ncbi:MAG: hypothetical protein ACK5OB_02920 [Pirellula sp.]
MHAPHDGTNSTSVAYHTRVKSTVVCDATRIWIDVFAIDSVYLPSTIS